MKQFTMVTIIVTALIAMFANGENAELTQALRDRDARNKLLKSEAMKVGVRSIKADRMIDRRKTEAGFETLNDSPDTDNTGYQANWDQSGGSSVGMAMAVPAPAPEFSDEAMQRAYARATSNGPSALPLRLLKARSKAFKRTKEELEELKRQARLRAGQDANGVDGD